jgi:hypothetical protein
MSLSARLLNKFCIPLLLAFMFGYFIYLMAPMLHADLWNDEIYTLEKFTLVPLYTTVTDYHVPNNHILYNIFDHFYLKLAGIKNLRQAMESVWLLRLPLLLLSLITLLLQYKTGKLAGGKVAGLLSAGILACSIPFQNFCEQVRGYPFSMFFDVLLVYNALVYIIYRRRINLLGILICSTAAVYTIPSNLYCVIALMAFLGVEWLLKSIDEKRFDKDNFYPAIAAAMGIAVALLLYLPVLRQVFTNEYVRGSAQTAMQLPAASGKPENMLLIFYNEIIAGQVTLYITFIFCSLLFFMLPLSAGQNKTGKVWKLILWQLITPVVMIVAQGQHPPDRVFAYLSPFVALLIGLTLAYVINALTNGVTKWIAIGLLMIYLIASCQQERRTIAVIMSRYLNTEERSQDLRTNYYQHNFHPLRVTEYVEQHGGKKDIPVIIKWSEPHDMPEYLESFGIPNYSADSLDNLFATHKKIYWITLFPHELDSTFLAAHHCAKAELLPPSYHHLFLLQSH